MTRALVTRRLAGDVMDYLAERVEVVAPPEDRPIPRRELLALAPGARGILAMLTDTIDEEVLAAAGPDLAVVANHAVGYDNVDLAACERRGVIVTNTPDVLTDATADMAWGLLLAAARRIAEGDRLMRRAAPWEWAPDFMLGREVTGATLGIVGYGRIGQAVARRAQGFGMTVLYYDTRRADAAIEAALGARFVDLDELLAHSDFVSLHVNLTDETRHLVNASRLASMRSTAVIVNTSRGPVVDQRALFEALRDGVIGAAALDVTDPEPIDADDPLLGLDNCLVVPHIASASRATRGKMAAMAAANLLAGVRGEPLPTSVNPEVRERR